MAKFPTYEQMAKDVAEKALDEILYYGKSIREWMKIIVEQEPKTGHWIDSVTCSCCGWAFIDDVIQSPNMVAFPYCPNCGAKMEEDER